jgi:two-component system, NtrC family, response regulator AtoC
MAEILIVDDDINLGLALKMTLEQAGHTCRIAETAEAGWAELRRQEPDLALLDVQLPDLSGLELLARVRQHGLKLPAIVMTAFGTVTSAVIAMKQGAEDFIEKPLSVKEVCQLVTRLLKGRELSKQLDTMGTDRPSRPGAPDFIAESPAMKQAISLADRIAELPSRPGIGLTTTLILGETGTGKEVLARYMHHRNCDRKGQFVHVNCTAIPDNLFETELFGHERGVFTDAKSAKQGLFEMADHGTLFLDEVGDLPLLMQAKVLVALESGRFRRIGATGEQTVDTKVIAATNCDLDEKLKAGQLRADLYHRLRMFQIKLPPLRDRGDDLFLLSDFFLARFCQQLQREIPKLSPEAREAMRLYAWPGNVRELAHILLQAVVADDSAMLSADHLGIGKESGGVALKPVSMDFDFSQGALPLESVERRLLQAALNHTNGNITEAARLVGMPRGTFRYRLEKLGLA